MEKDKNLVNLSLEEQQKIKTDMRNAISCFDPKNPKLSDELNMDIRLAVNSGVKELIDTGCELAYLATLNHYKKLAVKYQDPPRTEIEDLVNLELFSTIRDHIKNFDGIHSLFTFFDPYVKATFMKAREKGRGHVLTKHYMDSSVIIIRARRQLTGAGLTNVSSLDLSKWIKIHMNKDISPTTIERIDDLTVNVESLDGMVKEVADPTVGDPSKLVIQSKSEEKFWNTVEALSDRHKAFMAAALDFTDRTGCSPTAADALEICKTFIPDVTSDQATRLMRAAYTEFKRYNRRYRKHEDTPINNMRMFEDIQIMENEEKDIENALMDDTGFFEDDGFGDAEAVNFFDDDE